MSRFTRRPRLVAAVAAVAAASVALTPTSAPADPAPGAAGTEKSPTSTTSLPEGLATAVGPAGGLWAPRRLEVSIRKRAGQRVWVSPGTHFVTGDSALEFRSTRSSYDAPIVTTWTSGTDSGTLPAGTVTSFAGLDNFVTTTLTDPVGKVLKRQRLRVCFGEGASRARPDAPAHSGYPTYPCAWNPYALGTVQGLQAGWAAPLDAYGGIDAKLKRGRYTITTTLNPAVASALGVGAADRAARTTLVVRLHDHASHDHLTRPPSADLQVRPQGPAPRPAASEPPKASDGVLSEPRPDLRSLPAWQISLNRKGNLLRFGATVWNAGDSPLIVDGFRSADESVMDAYQYFFDADGTQTGYQRVGEIKFHGGNHQHWHFQDFARYRLLNADMTPAVTSGKVSFCLANTDVVDYTVAGADWNPYNTDLATSCGMPGSLSIREVLASGSGDTYAQFRTGQAFDISKLKNGWYWISVEANPAGRLVEGDTTNNVSLRKVRIGGKPGARTIRVPQVGLIDEAAAGYGY